MLQGHQWAGQAEIWNMVVMEWKGLIGDGVKGRWLVLGWLQKLTEAEALVVIGTLMPHFREVLRGGGWGIGPWVAAGFPNFKFTTNSYF